MLFSIYKSFLSGIHFFHKNNITQTIFVAGVQRSGTNMVMEAFKRSLETTVFHESDPIAFDSFEMRSPSAIHRIIDRSNTSHVVIKALCETHMVARLLDEFAPAKTVWMRRDFNDVVNSHVAKWTGMPESIRLIVEDRKAAGWRGRGMSDETHRLVCGLYHPELSVASACALFWYFRNVLFFEQGLDKDDRVIVMRYEDLVTDPLFHTPRLFEFLDLKFTPRISARFSPRSINKKPPPEIDPPITELCRDLQARFDAL